jgi:hypothetical protein
MSQENLNRVARFDVSRRMGFAYVTAPSIGVDSSPMPMFGGANVKDTGTFEVDLRGYCPIRSTRSSASVSSVASAL